jgi:hypothetical protein
LRKLVKEWLRRLGLVLRRIITFPAPVDSGKMADFERATFAATKVQMWSAVAAVLAAIVALWVSAKALTISDETWRSQRVLNSQQIELNEQSQRRDQQVYSSRVSMWATIGTVSSSVLPRGLDVHLQNRAPVPLHGVRIIAPLRQGEASVELGDLPPCVIDTLRIAPPTGGSFAAVRNAWLGYTSLSLVFTETGRGWRVTADRIELLRRPLPEPSGPGLQQANRNRESVGDCGEGS